MAKQIGRLGVTVSANTIGLQQGFASAAARVQQFGRTAQGAASSLHTASAGIRQFSATARVAAGIAGTFDSSLVRLGADTGAFANSVRLAAPGITSTFAGLAGLAIGLATNFDKLKKSAISAAEAIADFFTKPPENFLSSPGTDFLGRTPDRGPTMGADALRQIASQKNETSFARGDIGKEKFLATKHQIGGMGVFEAQQLAAAEMQNEAAQEAVRAAEQATKTKMELFQSEAAAERNTRRQNMIAYKEAQDEFIRFEHEKQKEAKETRDKQIQFAQDALTSAGLAKASQFESDPKIRGMMEIQERIDALRGGTATGTNFGISSRSFGGTAPVGSLIGEQTEQRVISTNIEKIRELNEELLRYVRKNGLGSGVEVTD